MPESTAAAVVDQYLAAVAGHAADAARALLDDHDFRFVSPIAGLDD